MRAVIDRGGGDIGTVRDAVRGILKFMASDEGRLNKRWFLKMRKGKRELNIK